MRRAFTLIEMLVAMAVMALVLVMMLQVTSGILASTQAQSRRIDSVAAARRVLDVMAADMRKAVVDDNTSVLVANSEPAFALLARRRGTNGASDRFLAVRYATNASNQVVRTYASVPFSETDLLAAPVDSTSGGMESILADGILAFQVRITTPSGFKASTSIGSNWLANSYNGATTPANWNALITAAPNFAADLTNRALSLRVWLAAADSQTIGLLESTGQLVGIKATLAGTEHAKDWRAAVDNSGLPPNTKSAIRILNKTIPLP
jgi:prepilin-type N-terminal cleavage/methylation domain-containing protein